MKIALHALPRCRTALLAQGGVNPGVIPPSWRRRPPTAGRPTTATTPAAASARSTKINQSNINSLSLAWVYRANGMPGGQSGFSGGRIKATPLLVNGVLYFTMPDHAWAVDARTGREIWHYAWTVARAASTSATAASASTATGSTS